MIYSYGYYLFEITDIVAAYNYIMYDEAYNPIIKTRDMKYANRFNNYDISKFIVLRANIKKVEAVTGIVSAHLCKFLEVKSYKCGIIATNPIGKYLPPINKIKDSDIRNKIYNYVYNQENYERIDFFIEGLNKNTKFEQFIKSRYGRFITTIGDRMYVKLCPQGTFNLLFNFMNDVLRFDKWGG